MGNPILGKDKPKKWIIKKEHIPIESFESSALGFGVPESSKIQFRFSLIVNQNPEERRAPRV